MTIKLQGRNAKGREAIVSPEDFERLSQYKWVLRIDRRNPHIQYARTYDTKKELYMHRLVIGDKKGLFVDHINRNTLDNRRENLRHVTPSESCFNRTMPRRTSKHSWRPNSERSFTTRKGKKWQSQVSLNGKITYLGLFNTVVEANNVAKQFLEVKESNHQ